MVYLDTVIKEFLNRPAIRSGETALTYQKDLAQFLHFVGDRPVDTISVRDIDLYWRSLNEHVSRRTGKPYSPATIQKKLKGVVALFNMCHKRGYIEKSPTVEVSMPNIIYDIEKKAISPELLLKMLDSVWDHSRQPERDYFILVALASMGFRRSDLANLRLGDVDTTKQIVYLRHRKGGRFQKLPIPGIFVRAYRPWITARPSPNPYHDFVLLSINATEGHPPLNASAISQAFRRLCKAITGYSYGPHSVRHAWALASLGKIPPDLAQRILGHKSARVFRDHYAVADVEDLRPLVDRHPLMATSALFDAAPVPIETSHEQNNEDVITIIVDASDWLGFN